MQGQFQAIKMAYRLFHWGSKSVQLAQRMYITQLIKTLVAVCATTWLVTTEMKGGDHVSKTFQQRALFPTLPYIALAGQDESECIAFESCNEYNVK